MELYTMRYVVSVADYKNFSLAAQYCHIGQPALSQQIAKLEKELGVTLFIRSSHGVVLTEAGEHFVRRAREILQNSSSLEAEMSEYAQLKSGTLNLGIITCLQCVDFSPMISAFCAAFPHISINIFQQGTHRLIDLLVDRSIDIAFLNHPVSQLPSSLNFSHLGKDFYSLAVWSDHPLASRKTVSLKELSEEKFIFHHPEQVASELCYRACVSAGFEPQIVCRSSNPSTTIYMVQGRLGIALLPSEEFQNLSVRGVEEIKIKEPIVKDVGITWRKDSASPIVLEMVRFARKWNEAASAKS